VIQARRKIDQLKKEIAEHKQELLKHPEQKETETERAIVIQVCDGPIQELESEDSEDEESEVPG